MRARTNRYGKTASGTTTQFLYDDCSVEEEMQRSTFTADYRAAVKKLSGNVSWMLQDGLRSTRQLLNSSQTAIALQTDDALAY